MDMFYVEGKFRYHNACITKQAFLFNRCAQLLVLLAIYLYPWFSLTFQLRDRETNVCFITVKRCKSWDTANWYRNTFIRGYDVYDIIIHHQYFILKVWSIIWESKIIFKHCIIALFHFNDIRCSLHPFTLSMVLSLNTFQSKC